MDRKIVRNSENFNLNPFSTSEENLLGLNSSLRNSLFYNRGKQKHSVTYTFLNSRVKSLLSIGAQENTSQSNQLQYAHLVKKTWLFNFDTSTSKSTSVSDNYATRNFVLNSYAIFPKISYLLSNNKSLSLFFESKNKQNKINEQAPDKDVQKFIKATWIRWI